MVACIWKKANTPQIIIPNYNENGWYNTGKIQWADKAFPESVAEILLDDDNKLAIKYGRNVPTNDEDENL